MLLSQRARTRFSRAVLLSQAAGLVGLGLAYWARPQEMANLAGILLMDGGSVGLMRAWLGALPLLLAVQLWRAQALPERLLPALAVVSLGSAGLLATRLISLGLEPGALLGFDFVCLLWWALSALLAGAAWWLMRERPAAEARIERPRMPLEPPAPFRLGEAHTPAPKGEAEGTVVAFRRSEQVDPAP